MMRMLLILTLFFPIFACKKQSASSDTPPAAEAPTSCEAYSPSGNNLNLAGAALTPLPPIDATQLQVDSLQVTLAPYTSGKDTYNALSFQVVGKSTSNVNLVSDYLQYKVCMKQNGSGGQNCLCNNGTGACPYQNDPAGNGTSVLFNEYSTGDYQVPDPYTTSWEVPVPVALSGVLSSTVRLCVRDNRKTSTANCGPWTPAVLRQVSGTYTQTMGQLKQTIQQISTQEGALAFSLVQSAKAYQQALSSIPYANQNNEERSLSLYASNFINFPDSTRQVLQNRDLYTQMLQEAQTTAAGGSGTGLAGGTTGTCAPIAAAIQSITSSPGTDAGISTLTETVVYTYTENGTLTSTVVQVAPGATTTVTINSTETATIVGPTVTQTDTVINNVTQVVTETYTQNGTVTSTILSLAPGASTTITVNNTQTLTVNNTQTLTVTSPTLLAALKKAAAAVVQSATDMQTKAGALQAASASDQVLVTSAQATAQTALQDAQAAQTAALDTTTDGTAATAALSQAQSDLTAAATALAAAQQAIAATADANVLTAAQNQGSAALQAALQSEIQNIETKEQADESQLAAQQVVFTQITASYTTSDTALAQSQVADALQARTDAQAALDAAKRDVTAAQVALNTFTNVSTALTTSDVTAAVAVENAVARDVAVAVTQVGIAQQKAAVAAAAIASAKVGNNSAANQAKKIASTPGYIVAAAVGIVGFVAAIGGWVKRASNGEALKVLRSSRAAAYSQSLSTALAKFKAKYPDVIKGANSSILKENLEFAKYFKRIEAKLRVDMAKPNADTAALEAEHTEIIVDQDELVKINNSKTTFLDTKEAGLVKSEKWGKGFAYSGVVLMVLAGALAVVQATTNVLNLAASSPRDQANLTFLNAITKLQNRYQALNTALDTCSLELGKELRSPGTATLANCRIP